MPDSSTKIRACRILIVVRDHEINRLLKTTLTTESFFCRSTTDYSRIKVLLSHDTYDLLISDRSPNNKAGLWWYDAIEKIPGLLGIILVASKNDKRTTQHVDRSWFNGVITTPVEPGQVMVAVKMALRMRSMAQSLNELQQTFTVLKTEQLEKEKALQGMDQALTVLLAKREQDKTALQDQIVNNIRSVIIPNIERLQKFRLSPRHLRMLDLIQTNLKEIASPFIKSLSSAYANLTPQEIQVADLIKQGKRTKEIATIMNLSTNTIMTHRYHIRAKLGLKNKKTHLATFLNTFTNQ